MMEHHLKREEFGEKGFRAGIVSLDYSKSKEQDELKDWAELGPLEVRFCLTLRSPEERGVRQASSKIAVAKGSTWQFKRGTLLRGVHWTKVVWVLATIQLGLGPRYN